jgi:hypothetical protein
MLKECDKEELINVFPFANQKLRKAGITRGC